MKIRALMFGLILTVVAALQVNADPSRLINYQGRLVDSNGVPLADGGYDMTFKIYDALTGGTLLWTEAHTGASAVTVTNGLFSVVLGPTSMPDFNSTPYYIEITVGATVYSPRKQLTGAPFAVNADLLDGQHASYYQRRVSGTCGVGSSIRIINADGTVTCQTDVGSAGHGSLSGLGNDDHTQYVHISTARTITAQHSFAPAAAQAPFTLGGNAQGQLVTGLNADLLDGYTTGNGSGNIPLSNGTVNTNLNADMLDGYHASSFILDGCTDCLNATEIEDIYVLNTSDTMSGSLGIGTTLSVGTSATVGTTLGVTGAITGSSTITGTRLISNIATGTSPLSVTSTTVNTNLNADMLDGYHYTSFILDGCTDCLNATEIEDIYVFNTSDTMSGSLGIGTTLSVGTSATVGTTLGVTGAITGASTVQGTRFISTIVTGTSPLSVTSTTVNTNLNADLLDGYHASTTRNAANTIPIRDANGYLQLGWINTTSGDNGTTAITKIYASSDDYIRYYTPANFVSVMSGYLDDSFVLKAGDTMTGELITPAIRVPATAYSSGVAVDFGDASVDYPANAGWAATYNATVLLSGLDSTSIAFHDAGQDVGVLRYRDNNFYMGETGPWGVSNLTVGGDVTVAGSDLYLTDGNTRLTEGAGNALRMQTGTGYIDIGSQNAGWAHITTDRPSFYFNPKITVDGNVEPYTTNTRTLGTSALRWSNAYLTTLDVTSTSLVSNLNADYVDGYHAPQLGNFGNWEPHGTYTDCNANPNYWGWNYVQGNTNCPNTTSTQWYRGSFSLGSNYPMRGAGGYSMELAIPRYSVGSAGVWVRTVENGGIGGWSRIDGADPNAGAWTLSGSNLYPDSTSYNVGIGMTAPSTKLHVTGDIAATGWIGAGCEGACESGGGYGIMYADGHSVQTSYNRADGGYQVDGNQVIDSDAGWHRSYGATGWYNGSYGGGIWMQDSTWVRVYGNKDFYNPMRIRADGSFWYYASASGSSGPSGEYEVCMRRSFSQSCAATAGTVYTACPNLYMIVGWGNAGTNNGQVNLLDNPACATSGWVYCCKGQW